MLVLSGENSKVGNKLKRKLKENEKVKKKKNGEGV
jgi:hypothetical protein